MDIDQEKSYEKIVTNLCCPIGTGRQSSSETPSSVSKPSSSSSSILENHKCYCPIEPPAPFIPPPNIQLELNNAKSLLLENSSVSGDNLFDHLAELIRKITVQRPPNVVDYFEEYSRNLREQKFHNPDNSLEPASEEPRTLRSAENMITSLKLHNCDRFEELEDDENNKCDLEDFHQLCRPIKSTENVLQIKLFWSMCGLGFQYDEVFQLSCAMMKLIQCPIINVCRFWGKMYGIKKSYYICEVDFIQEEKELRYQQMCEEMEEKICNYQRELMETRFLSIDGNCGDELIPGLNWINDEYENVEIMKIDTAQIPKAVVEEKFDIPPEPVGSGLNRCSYFAITCLTDDWIELPIVTPSQVVVARNITKLFTGDFEANVSTYPDFPGKEKHYLRATIARITASTYIAPLCYYKKRTKRDDKLAEGEYEDDEEEEEEEQEEEDGGLTKERLLKLLKERDAEIILNKKYVNLPTAELASISQWVHTRPSILDQGRVMYFDMKKALNGDEEEIVEEEEEEEGVANKGVPDEAIGPALFSACEDDMSSDIISVWTPRLTSHFNKMNIMAIMRSNIWPGSISFTYENFCDTIYLGWGKKYVPRNYYPIHVPEIQDEYPLVPELIEILDPTPAMEESWRLAHMINVPPVEEAVCYEEENSEDFE